MRDHEDQDVSSFHWFNQVWNSHLMEKRDNKRDKFIMSNPFETTQKATVVKSDVLMLTTLGGSLWPGRYLTFSWSVLMISVSLRPSTISSNTHMLTVVSNLSYLAALAPTILAMAEPLLRQRHVIDVWLSRHQLLEPSVVSIELWLFFSLLLKCCPTSWAPECKKQTSYTLII